MELLYWLRQTGLFTHIDDSHLSAVSRSFDRARYQKGDLILKEGELGDAFYIIEYGRVLVYALDLETGEEVELARLDAGNYFGEQALLGDVPKPRNASVKALSDVIVLKISAEQLSEILHFDITLHEKLISTGAKRRGARRKESAH